VSSAVTGVADQLTHTVQFSRKVSVRQYESAEASIFIQYSTDRDASPEEIIAGGTGAFLQAKGVVFAELGLDADLNDNNILLEAGVTLVERTFGPGVEKVQSSVKERAIATTSTPVPDVAGGDVSAAKPPFDPYTKDKDEKAANSKWAKERLASNPNEFWDNREDKRNPKAPDFKHRDSGVGVWVDSAAA
jgi:hypothetical protein